jgi:hypothetical protein
MSVATLTPSDIEDIVAPATENYVDEDGYIIDSAGEVVGRVGVPDRFEINSEDSANWALELRSKLEGDIAGIDARLKAVTAQLHDIRKQKLQKLAWWDYRFSSQLVGFARRFIDGKKERTAQFTWGKVAFRKTVGRTEILDMTHAVAFVRTYEPDAVKVVESVTLKDIKKARETAGTLAGEELEALPFLASSGPGESITISTGIEVERSKS